MPAGRRLAAGYFPPSPNCRKSPAKSIRSHRCARRSPLKRPSVWMTNRTDRPVGACPSSSPRCVPVPCNSVSIVLSPLKVIWVTPTSPRAYLTHARARRPSGESALTIARTRGARRTRELSWPNPPAVFAGNSAPAPRRRPPQPSGSRSIPISWGVPPQITHVARLCRRQ